MVKFIKQNQFYSIKAAYADRRNGVVFLGILSYDDFGLLLSD